MNRDIFIDFVNKTLQVAQPEKDPWVFNGLQVIGKPEVKKIALGVSPTLAFFQKAADWGADLIILHHGLFGPKRPQLITKVLKKRLKVLFDSDITLLSYHLYLDKHEKLGNNAQIINLLGAKIGEKFGEQNGLYWGYEASYVKPISETDFLARIKKLCPQTRHFGNGNNNISSFGVVSGGGAYNVIEAIDKNFDAFLTGEIVESISSMAQEANLHYYCLGHYNSEKFGVQALGKVILSKFPQLKVKFIDVPNEL